MCRKQPGIGIGRVCEKCDGRCVVCDSFVRPCTLVRICDECNYGSAQGRCVVCGAPGVADAYYCKECTILEKDVCSLSFPPLLHCFSQLFFSCPNSEKDVRASSTSDKAAQTFSTSARSTDSKNAESVSFPSPFPFPLPVFS